jgi:thiol-disulfide isomerase/thioredoxin
MALLTRRGLIAAGATVIAAMPARKPATAQEPATPQVGMMPLSAIVAAKPPTTLPPVTFGTMDGGRCTLAEFAGRPVVLNFWATWCVPCVAELPELDRLAATGAFTVIAVSADRGGAAVVKPFAASHHITHLTLLLDPATEALHALGVAGFPTTLLIGADGKLHGTMEGPAAWGGAASALTALLAA